MSSRSSCRARSPRRPRSPSCSTRPAYAASLGPNVPTPAVGGGQQPAQPRDDRARAGHGRHAAHRPGRGRAASRCWRSAGCARSACSAPWAPPTGTSAWWSGSTASWWAWSARWPGPSWAWPRWLAYRPRLESDAHHLIGVFQLPWIVIGPAMALAVVATYFAASRPARSVTRIPVVAALSGRPAPPKQVHRSALPGVILFVDRRGPAVVLRQEQRQRRRCP